MAHHQPFSYASREDLLRSARGIGLELPLQDDLSPLFEPLRIGDTKLPNRLAVHPMEGADASPNGAPSELTFRRYRRYAEGGSGLIWFEATAVVAEGRANPRQLMITSENLEVFQDLVEQTREAARRGFGDSHEILCVLQLTHSGRYSKPQGQARPLVAVYNPYLDRPAEDVHVLSDQELDLLQDDYLEAARLAQSAGFDAVDIKSCHGYLLNELLAGYSREHSRYGSSFENRTRFLTEVYTRLRAEVPRLMVSSRLNAFDGIPFPYGFGFSKDTHLEIDLTEMKVLTRRLLLIGGRFFSYTAGIPYLKPHLGRPFDLPLPGNQPPDEHPLEGVRRLLSITGALQQSFPNVPVLGVGYSWLRQYFPYVAAAVVQRGEAALIGMGRSAFAYPEAPRDLMHLGELDPKKVCIACSKCSRLLRQGARTGCVVRDADVYAKEYSRLTGKDA
jgi:2,4-dienoyl-CoA reductase (NADPH2)